MEDQALLQHLGKLGPETRLGVARGMIKRFVELNPDGVTANAVANQLGLSHLIAKRHLDYLVATRQIYAHEAGPRTEVYFPNARLSHPYARTIFRMGDQVFRVHLIENPRGRFAYVQEMRSSPSVGEQVVGGIIVRLENLPEFISKLREFVETTAVESHDAKTRH